MIIPAINKPYNIIGSSDYMKNMSVRTPRGLANKENTENGLHSGLVLVHSTDELIKNLPESDKLKQAIVIRIQKYIQGRRRIFYLPFLAKEKEIPEFMSKYSRNIEMILLGNRHRLEFVQYQAEHLAMRCRDEKIHSLEVGGLYRYACVNATATALTRKGFEVTVNTDLTNASNAMFQPGGPLAGKLDGVLRGGTTKKVSLGGKFL